MAQLLLQEQCGEQTLQGAHLGMALITDGQISSNSKIIHLGTLSSGGVSIVALVDGATLDMRRDWDGSEGWGTATCTA